MTDQEAVEEYRQRTLKYFMRQALSEEDAEYMTSIEMRGYERGIAHERAKMQKVREALEFYGDNSLGGGCWTFREKFFFDLTHEHDLDQLPEPVGERGQKYITGGKVARTALAKAREILKEGEL